MPNIAKIVCGTYGGCGAGGAITPGQSFTLTVGYPNTVLSLTVDYLSPFMPPKVRTLTLPEHDAMLCKTLDAVAGLEPGAEKSGAYVNEITLDDGTVYRVSYPQLNALISALWRARFTEDASGDNPNPFLASAFAAPPAGAWNCPFCGTQGLTGKFCIECGSPKPETADAGNP